MPVPVHLDQSCHTPELPSIRMHVSPVVVVEQCFTVWRSVSRCNNCFISKRTFFSFNMKSLQYFQMSMLSVVCALQFQCLFIFLQEILFSFTGVVYISIVA